MEEVVITKEMEKEIINAHYNFRTERTSSEISEAMGIPIATVEEILSKADVKVNEKK